MTAIIMTKNMAVITTMMLLMEQIWDRSYGKWKYKVIKWTKLVMLITMMTVLVINTVQQRLLRYARCDNDPGHEDIEEDVRQYRRFGTSTDYWCSASVLCLYFNVQLVLQISNATSLLVMPSIGPAVYKFHVNQGPFS